MNASDIDIISLGLADALEEHSRSETVKRGYIKEAARIAVSEEPELIGELFAADGYEAATPSALLSSLMKLVGDGDGGGLLAKYISEVFESRFGRIALSASFPDATDTDRSAAFVSGSGADAAYEIFARRFGLSAVHTGRISAACDAVLDGDAGYCILPVVSSKDGRLRSFYRMIDVYGLKISATVTVESAESTMRYALCGKNSAPVFSTPSGIELSVPCNGKSASSLIRAAEALGHTLSEVSSYPSERDGEVFSFTFSVGGEYNPFFLYLNLFFPHFTLTGIYSDITV